MNCKAIGIDLGTTYTCVGVYHNGRIDIIPNVKGNHTTPTSITFTEMERLIGDTAKDKLDGEPANNIFNLKRIIGRRFADQNIQASMHLWPFTVMNDGGNPKIRIVYKGEVKYFTPEELTSMVLYKIKCMAEVYIRGPVRDAVITVPAYFNNHQRQATRDAGVIAGLNVLKIVNEPTAAALAYGFENNYTGTHKVLIFDLGGGACDVSILTIEQGLLYEVNSTVGDTTLGGDDFDNRLVKYFTDEIQTKYRKDITRDVKAMRKLKYASEQAKKILSSTTEAVVEIQALFDGRDFRSTITRDTFELINFHLFRLTLELIQKALFYAQLPKRSINDVILIGGSTRIPIVQNLIRTYFYGKTLNLTINPDEAVAYGAAVQAAILSNANIKIKEVVLIAVTPLSLGIEIAGGIMMKIIERNSRIPCKVTKCFSTYSDYQQAVSIKIFEGERALTKDNNLMGKFTLRRISPATRGIPKINLTFQIDDNGILHVSATDDASGNTRNLVIDKDKVGLSHGEIQKMLANAEKYQQEDKILQVKAEVRYEMEKLAFGIKHAMEETASEFTESERDKVYEACEESLFWLKNNLLAENTEVKKKKLELVQRCSPIMSQHGKSLQESAGACKI